jgi:hypothetical protein
MNPLAWLISWWCRWRNGPYVDSSPPTDDTRVPSDFDCPNTQGIDDDDRMA